ncbi:hypothetical protein IEO21_10850 [Rhodonia placenta]|uniref:Uncharacterized protein n=1 Tax=Rhodonia placenta TaxID=104341 RepID=A0A8H7TX49_9APHY|nr:hypothetical protein IEO21_10850 [Postia placenta]
MPLRRTLRRGLRLFYFQLRSLRLRQLPLRRSPSHSSPTRFFLFLRRHRLLPLQRTRYSPRRRRNTSLSLSKPDPSLVPSPNNFEYFETSRATLYPSCLSFRPTPRHSNLPVGTLSNASKRPRSFTTATSYFPTNVESSTTSCACTTKPSPGPTTSADASSPSTSPPSISPLFLTRPGCRRISPFRPGSTTKSAR